MDRNLKNSKVYVFILTVAFLVVNSVIYAQLGLKVMGDSPRYIGWAQDLWVETLSVYQWKFWYLGYVFFLSILSNISLEFVIFCQIVLGYIACLCIFGLTKCLTASSRVALVASLLYVCWFEISLWNVYILTESLFTSSIVILVFLSLKYIKRKFAAVYLLPMLLFVILIRPMGVTVLISSGVFIYYYFDWHRKLQTKQKTLFFILSAACLSIFFFFLLEGNQDVHFYYGKGQVVWGADQMPELKENTWLVVDNSTVVYPAKNLSAIRKFLEFTTTNFRFQAELFSKKIVLFIIHVKPYYSHAHNLFILLTLLPTYLLCFIGLRDGSIHPALRFFSISLFTSTALMVGLSVEAWDGRFLIPTLPFLFTFASIGLKNVLNKYTLLRL